MTSTSVNPAKPKNPMDAFLDWERMVVVCAQHGEKFLGWVPPDKELKKLGCNSPYPKDYMYRCLNHGTAVELRDVRILASQLQATPDGKGGIASIGNLMVLMPVDMFPQGMEKHYIKVSTYYFPSDNEDCKPLIEGLVKDAIQMEGRRAVLKDREAAEKSAKDAGIILPPGGGKIAGGH